MKIEIVLTQDQQVALDELYEGRQDSNVKETKEELVQKVFEMGLMQLEYRRKYNKRNYAEYKAWKQSTR